MRPSVFPKEMQEMLTAAPSLGADSYDVQLLRDYYCLSLQIQDGLDLSTREYRKWWASNLAMSLGENDCEAPNFRETLTQAQTAVLAAPGFKPYARQLWASMVQQITPEWRAWAKGQMIWFWEI